MGVGARRYWATGGDRLRAWLPGRAARRHSGGGQSGAGQSGAARSGAGRSGGGQPGAGQSAAGQSGAGRSGAGQSGASGPTARQSGSQATHPLAELYAAYCPSLLRLATLLVGDAATAEQIVEDSFVALHNGRRHLDNERALCYLRQFVVKQSRSARWQGIGPDIDVSCQAVISALLALPPRQREALVLRYYAGLAEAQVATVMKISKSAVRVHVRRALAALRDVLDHVSTDDDHRWPPYPAEIGRPDDDSGDAA
jgi:DNA-directed RNA polymerase specialized sigma24 family protein